MKDYFYIIKILEITDDITNSVKVCYNREDALEFLEEYVKIIRDTAKDEDSDIDDEEIDLDGEYPSVHIALSNDWDFSAEVCNIIER